FFDLLGLEAGASKRLSNDDGPEVGRSHAGEGAPKFARWRTRSAEDDRIIFGALRHFFVISSKIYSKCVAEQYTANYKTDQSTTSPTFRLCDHGMMMFPITHI